MSFTIYTVSDPSTVGSVMTSMAMFFGQDSWVGSALKLALVISLIGILAKGVTRDGLRLDVMLLQLLVVMAAFIPKTTVTIEQFDNNAPARVVDGVPYAIAIPGSVAGAFALYMTQKIETVMSGVNGKYLPPSGEISPFTPARLLMTVATTPLDPSRSIDPNLQQTMYYAARYCAGPTMTNIKFDQSPNVIRSFASGLTNAGVTQIYTTANPYLDGGGTGTYASCDDVVAYLNGIANDLEAGNTGIFTATLNGIASSNDVKRYTSQNNTASSPTTWDDMLPVLNRVSSDAANITTLSATNVMMFTLASQIARNAKSPIDQIVEIQRDTGLFQWAKEEAAQSMQVASTAPKFMDILFFIFIAATPLVMFVVAANPSTGIKVAGSYVLFGVWTQSWIPMMAIISGWYQAEIMNFAGPGPSGMTAEYMSGLMRHVNTTTIAASNMLQNAPYMTFAIMTGSMFALSNMISKAAPASSAHGDIPGVTSTGSGSSKGGSGMIPGAGGNDASPAMGQIATFSAANSALSGGLGGNASFVGGSASANLPSIPSLNLSGAIDTGVSAANERSAAVRSGLQKQQAQAVSDLSSLITGSGHSIDGKKMATHLRSQGFDSSYDANTGILRAGNSSVNMRTGQVNTSAFGTKMEGGVQGSFGTEWKSDNQILGKIASLISGAGVDGRVAISGGLSASRSGSSTASTGLEESKSNGTTISYQNGNGNRATTGENGSVGASGSEGNNWSETAQKAQQIANTFSSIASVAKSLDEADKVGTQAQQKASVSTSASIKGSDVVDNWSAGVAKNQGHQSSTFGEALNRVAGSVGNALQGAALGAVLEAATARNQEMLRSGLGGTLNEDQRAAAAMWHALSDRSVNGKSAQDKSDATSAMLSLASASGVTPGSGALETLKAANAIISNAEGRVNGMSQELKPTVDAVPANVDRKLESGVRLQSNVDDKIANDKNTAASTYAGANTAAQGVYGAGVGQVDKHAAQNQYGVPKDSDLARESGVRSQNMPFIPTDGNQAGLNRDKSVAGQVLTGAGKLLEGAINLGKADSKSLLSGDAGPVLLSGAQKEGEKAASGVLASAQSPVANPVLGMQAGVSEVISQGQNAATALPTLGGGQGSILGGAAGSTTVVQANQANSAQSTNAKPNARPSAGSTEKDASKAAPPR